MLKRSITYIDPWTNEKRTDDFYFHFTEMELVRLQTSHEGKLQDEIKRIGNGDASQSEIIAMFEEFVSKSYGVRTQEGRFMKSPEITSSFLVSEPYSSLIVGFFTSEQGGQEAADFLNGLMPADLLARAKDREEGKKEPVVSDQPSQERVDELRARLTATPPTPVVQAEVYPPQGPGTVEG